VLLWAAPSAAEVHCATSVVPSSRTQRLRFRGDAVTPPRVASATWHQSAPLLPVLCRVAVRVMMGLLGDTTSQWFSPELSQLCAALTAGLVIIMVQVSEAVSNQPVVAVCECWELSHQQLATEYTYGRGLATHYKVSTTMAGMQMFCQPSCSKCLT
jgi:hypothetical protein